MEAGGTTFSRIVAVVAIGVVIVVGLVVSSGSMNSSRSTPPTASTSALTGASASLTSSSSSPASSSSVGSPNPTVEASNSSLGLELLASVNATDIPSEDSINVSMWMMNTRSSANNLSAANDWPVHGLSSWPCGVSDWYPAGLAVYRGYYEVGNVSDGRPLNLWSSLMECPAEPIPSVTSYSFLPRDDIANYSGTSSGSGGNPTRVESSVPIDFAQTLYAANGTEFYSSLGSSLPSAYTLVAGDEWGQIVLMHFRVTPSDNLPRVGDFLSSTGGCSPGPCAGFRLSDAIVFNCASAAATPTGCSATYSEGVRYSAAPIVNYTVTVWYPSYNQPNEPASANCEYEVSPVGALMKPDAPPSFGYCLMINSTSFVVSFD